jgi:hypothetical protein
MGNSVDTLDVALSLFIGWGLGWAVGKAYMWWMNEDNSRDPKR